MKITIAILLMLAPVFAPAQSNTSVSVIDFVKIKNNHQEEAMYYYRHNWKAAREIALRKGYIQSYSLLSTRADSTANFDLMLITVYKDSSQMNRSEENFSEIFKEMGTANGPKLLNKLKPAEFRQNLFFKMAEHIFENRTFAN